MDACTYTRTVGLTTQKHNASGLISGMDRTGSTTRPNYLFTRCSNITVLLLINGHFPRWSSVSWLTIGSSTSICSRKEPMAINEISFIMGQIFSCHQQSKHFSKYKASSLTTGQASSFTQLPETPSGRGIAPFILELLCQYQRVRS